MPRRIGFGGGREDDARAAMKRQPVPPEAVERGPQISGKQGTAAFGLAVWLALWGAGLAFAIILLLDRWNDGDTAGAMFLTVWCVFAAISWLIGAGVIRRVLRGRPITMRGRGAASSDAEDDWNRDVRG